MDKLLLCVPNAQAQVQIDSVRVLNRNLQKLNVFPLTSHGGGALRYDGTILNVTEPRASRCKVYKNTFHQNHFSITFFFYIKLDNTLFSCFYAYRIFFDIFT